MASNVWQAILTVRDWGFYYNHQRCHRAFQSKCPAELFGIDPVRRKPEDLIDQVSALSLEQLDLRAA